MADEDLPEARGSMLQGLMQSRLTGVETFIVLTDAQHMPVSHLKNLLCFEELIAGRSDEFDWPELDENAASSLCYTSGTTGNPKGVLFSHRSTLLHAVAIALPDVMNLGQRDCVLPIVPLFHVNAWGVPYAVPLTGAKLVLPGASAGDGAVLHELMNPEQSCLGMAKPSVHLKYVVVRFAALITRMKLRCLMQMAGLIPVMSQRSALSDSCR